MDQSNSSVEQKNTNLPEAPYGMITVPAPKGFDGYAFVPEPTGLLMADQLDVWLTRKIPSELLDSSNLIKEAYTRFPLVELHFTRDGVPVEINDQILISKRYPAKIAYFIVEETEKAISASNDPKE